MRNMNGYLARMPQELLSKFTDLCIFSVTTPIYTTSFNSITMIIIRDVVNSSKIGISPNLSEGCGNDGDETNTCGGSITH